MKFPKNLIYFFVLCILIFMGACESASDRSKELKAAVYRGDVETVKYLFAKGVKPHPGDALAAEAIRMMADEVDIVPAETRLELLRVLAKNEVDFNEEDARSQTVFQLGKQIQPDGGAKQECLLVIAGVSGAQLSKTIYETQEQLKEATKRATDSRK